MMAVPRTSFLGTPFHGIRNLHILQMGIPSPTMAMNSKPYQTRNEEQVSTETKKLSISPLVKIRPSSSNLQFGGLQPSEKDLLVHEDRVEFGRFVAREAAIDEEYWTAAWLRAETHWENHNNDRYVDNYKRKFAEQEFNAMKRRSKRQFGERCTCIVAVKKEEKNVKRTVLKSVVGTLDLSFQYLKHEETFPGERVRAPPFCSINKRGHNRYGYIANLCVAKSARRQGIGSNMLHFAIQSARSNGAEQVFVHVHRSNIPAQQLYENMGFEVVEPANPQLVKEQTYLLRFRT